MNVDRRRGRLTMKLHPAEVDLLTSLLDELDVLLAADPDLDDPVQQRLFPAAHPDDEAASAEFRELTETGLRTERTDRTGLCRADLATSPDVDLTDPDVAARWIQVLNDLRLALGTRIGVGQDDGIEDPLNADDVDPDDPQAQPLLIYRWLTLVQDVVLSALMR